MVAFPSLARTLGAAYRSAQLVSRAARLRTARQLEQQNFIYRIVRPISVASLAAQRDDNAYALREGGAELIAEAHGCSLDDIWYEDVREREVKLSTEQSGNAQMFVWRHSIAGLRLPHNIQTSCCDTRGLWMIAASLGTHPCYRAIHAWWITNVATEISRVMALRADIASSSHRRGIIIAAYGCSPCNAVPCRIIQVGQ